MPPASFLFDKALLLHGDRCAADDTTLEAGLGWVGKARCVFLSSDEKGLSPAAARKCARLLRLAEQTKVPALLLGTMTSAYRQAEVPGEFAALARATVFQAFVSTTAPLVALLREEDAVDEAAFALFDVPVFPASMKQRPPGVLTYDASSAESCRRVLEVALESATRLDANTLESRRAERLTEQE